MNVLLVSQCSKNALAATRRVLDQFAERCGTRTWQTHITEQGLATLRKLLKSTARRNTAVACHWVRGKNHTELLWIVGNARQFSLTGAVPTHTTREDIQRRSDENDWHTLEDMRILAAIAGLFHDFGKANASFQNKIKNDTMWHGEPLRHEWVSLRLFRAFVASCYEKTLTEQSDDQVWLQELAGLNNNDPHYIQSACLQVMVHDRPDSRQNPFKSLPPLARTVAWLVLTHHRLPDVSTLAWTV